GEDLLDEVLAERAAERVPLGARLRDLLVRRDARPAAAAALGAQFVQEFDEEVIVLDAQEVADGARQRRRVEAEEEEVGALDALEAGEDLVRVHAPGADVQVTAELLEDAPGLLLVRVEDAERAVEERVGADLVDGDDRLSGLLVSPKIEITPPLPAAVREEDVD